MPQNPHTFEIRLRPSPVYFGITALVHMGALVWCFVMPFSVPITVLLVSAVTVNWLWWLRHWKALKAVTCLRLQQNQLTLFRDGTGVEPDRYVFEFVVRNPLLVVVKCVNNTQTIQLPIFFDSLAQPDMKRLCALSNAH